MASQCARHPKGYQGGGLLWFHRSSIMILGGAVQTGFRWLLLTVANHHVVAIDVVYGYCCGCYGATQGGGRLGGLLV